jgi:ABC-2 type transport system permease protein
MNSSGNIAGALFYLQYHSIKNRFTMRIKRLKRPKYLVSAIFGALYFYFYFFRYLFGMGGARRRFSGGAASLQDLVLYESLGALVLLVFMLLAWLIPHERAALAFTEAEVAFLFPAPVTRRGLIHFKLLRSQAAILFTTLFLVLLTNRSGTHAWIRAAGWWLILCTLNLHFLASSFARTILLERGITNWQRRLAVLLIVSVLASWVITWAVRTIPAPDVSEWDSLDAVKQYISSILTAGPMPYLLYPLRLVVRPYLAQNATAFLLAIGPALALLAIHYWWVMRADVSFEEASVEASKKLADRVAAIRSGNWRGSRSKPKSAKAPFALAPTGPKAIALLWKNLISASQGFTFRMWLVLAVLGIMACVLLKTFSAQSGVLPALSMVALIVMIWVMLLGPQFARQDFRQDLPLADLLKSYPMRGWQIALGELLAPAVILTAIQWFLLLVALGFLSQIPGGGQPLGLGTRLLVGLGIACIIPMLNLITLQIPNAAVLLFPAWFQVGKEGPQGIEATGQRIVFMFGSLLAFIVVLIPAGIVFGIVFALTKLFLGWMLAVPIASVAAAVALGGEAALGIMLLGLLFERFDLSAEG